MVLEPLENRQLLAVDGLNEAGTEWTDELLEYEETGQPSSSKSMAAAYDALLETPVDGEAVVAETASEVTDETAAEQTATAEEVVAASSEGYTFDSLSEESSLGPAEGSGGALPDSAVSTISAMEEWDARASEELGKITSATDSNGSIVSYVDNSSAIARQ